MPRKKVRSAAGSWETKEVFAMNETILTIFVLIGTVPAAISGAMLGIKKEMDMFGVAVLGLVTGVGGGAIRDILLGITPPAMFRDPIFAFTAIVTAMLTFLRVVHHEFTKHPVVYEMMMLITDSVGLGVFTMVGVQTAYAQEQDYSLFLIVFVGTITGVGGGILRDVLADKVPYILEKHHLYATACIVGALAGALLWPVIGDLWAMIAGTVLVFLIRVLAAHFRWSLPQAKE